MVQWYLHTKTRMNWPFTFKRCLENWNVLLNSWIVCCADILDSVIEAQGVGVGASTVRGSWVIQLMPSCPEAGTQMKLQYWHFSSVALLTLSVLLTSLYASITHIIFYFSHFLYAWLLLFLLLRCLLNHSICLILSYQWKTLHSHNLNGYKQLS